MKRIVPFAVCVAFTCACDRLIPGGGGEVPDGSTADGAGDANGDADAGDAGGDAAADTGGDAGADAASDAAADAGFDATTDAGSDAGTDAGSDAGSDGGAPTAHGRVTFEDRLDDLNGPGSFVTAPVGGVEVDLVNANGDIIAWDYTDEDGRWSFTHDGTSPPAAKLQVWFEDLRDVGPFKVQDEQGTLYIIEDSRAVPWTGAALDVHYAKTSTGGAVSNLFTTVRRSLAKIHALTGSAGPEFHAVWRRGYADDCYTCYWESAIYVAGLSEDPDEYDDSVIAHEVGHFFAEMFSADDSDGGNHGSDRSTPTLAWSEGFATFFGGTVRENPYYVDADATDYFVDDIEGATDTAAFGTDGNSMTGDVAELLVAAAMWDLRDAHAEAHDALDVSDDEAFDPALSYFTGNSFADRGVAGTDFVDYLDGWFCKGHGHFDEVHAIVVADRQFPYDFPTLPACPKPRAPVVFTGSALRALAPLDRVTVRVVEVLPDGTRHALTPARAFHAVARDASLRPWSVLGSPPRASRAGAARYLSVETISPGGLRRHRSFALDR